MRHVRRVAPGEALQDRAVKVLDGTTLTLPDTPENQAAYPRLSRPRHNYRELRHGTRYRRPAGI